MEKTFILGVIAKELIARTTKKEGINQRIVGPRYYNFLKRQSSIRRKKRTKPNFIWP